jgi:hypothetical protein
MRTYNVEIRTTQIYQVESIRARNEEDAIAKALKKYDKSPKEYFSDASSEAESEELEA